MSKFLTYVTPRAPMGYLKKCQPIWSIHPTVWPAIELNIQINKQAHKYIYNIYELRALLLEKSPPPLL